MTKKDKNSKENKKIKNKKTSNPITGDVDTNMNKPVRGLDKV